MAAYWWRVCSWQLACRCCYGTSRIIDRMSILILELATLPVLPAVGLPALAFKCRLIRVAGCGAAASLSAPMRATALGQWTYAAAALHCRATALYSTVIRTRK